MSESINDTIDKSIKKRIDSMSYEQMLTEWRFSPPGHPYFTGKVGEYFGKVMKEKKEKVDHVQISKDVGWEG